MDSLIIEGGTPLSGEIRASGNKNAVLPMIAAALLTEEKVVLRNTPNIVDVRVMMEILHGLGVSAEFADNTLTIQAKTVGDGVLSRDVCSRIRTSVLFIAPLLHRVGRCECWPPGGDVIGRRRLDGHFYGLRSLGADIAADEVPFTFTAKRRLRGRELFLDEASVTATEQILIAAALAEGETIIRNAAAEPHVEDLALLLNKMGANISGMGTNTLTIVGVERLHGAEHDVVADHVEVGSFLAMVAATGGEITVHGTTPRHYWMTRRVFERMGIHLELRPGLVRLAGGQRPRIQPDFGNAVPVISDGPWPQYPSDMMSCTIVMATQAEGTVLFFEKMFESRIYFVDRLISMGANAIVCDPHRVVISGPASLRGVEVSSPDIRAGMAMLIAALCAKGRSVIHGANVIARGYENVVEKITSLNGRVERAE